MTATLYALPGSHPSMTARLMLERKGIVYKRRDLIPIASKGVLRAAGFPGITVPALKLDDTKVQGSKEIARELDRVQPEPPLFPADAEQRVAVEGAETWGDEVLQPVARRILWNGLKRDRSTIRSYSEGPVMGVPVGIAAKTAAPIVAMSARFNHADNDTVKADLASLPSLLDRVDRWIEQGVIGGDQPNAADYQIATSLRLLMTMDDLRSLIEARPAGKLALRLAPHYPGHLPAVLPPEWLAELRN
ncbi:MAG: glutathione S-transferase [Solirubrobacterales bacterium]|jgi:glutathione S-transferase|nr:glutathione S-transferase [Solirubrobacterales bacterium]MDX6652403.1 glutathione S-transferase [Solirubrobacterales bacterium]MDX6662248.1 glutathione S-transferase [Solirubrobacterales bacterium]